MYVYDAKVQMKERQSRRVENRERKGACPQRQPSVDGRTKTRPRLQKDANIHKTDTNTKNFRKGGSELIGAEKETALTTEIELKD